MSRPPRRAGLSAPILGGLQASCIRHVAVVALAVLMTAPVGSQSVATSFEEVLRAQDLDGAAIARALKAGADDKFGSWTAECRAEASRSERRAAGPIRRTGSYDVVVSTNLGAVAFLAHQAEEGGQTLGVSDVPSWVLGAAVYVFVEPRKPPRDWGAPTSGRMPIIEMPSSIEQVVLNSKAAPASVPPTPEDFEPADASFTESKWLVSQLPHQIGPDGRLRPMVFENSRARATFSLESIKALPAGDLDVVIVTKDAERRCSIPARDRARLFP